MFTGLGAVYPSVSIFRKLTRSAPSDDVSPRSPTCRSWRCHRSPGEPRSRIPDAIIVAPATFNLLNQWAIGIADSYALAVLAEQTGMAIPTVVVPAVSAPLASRPQFARLPKLAPRISLLSTG